MQHIASHVIPVYLKEGCVLSCQEDCQLSKVVMVTCSSF